MSEIKSGNRFDVESSVISEIRLEGVLYAPRRAVVRQLMALMKKTLEKREMAAVLFACGYPVVKTRQSAEKGPQEAARASVEAFVETSVELAIEKVRQAIPGSPLAPHLRRFDAAHSFLSIKRQNFFFQIVDDPFFKP